MYDPRVFGAHPGHLTKPRSKSERQRREAGSKDRQRAETEKKDRQRQETVEKERQREETLEKEWQCEEPADEEREREETVNKGNWRSDHVSAWGGRATFTGKITPNYRSDNPPAIPFAWEEAPGKARLRDIGEEVRPRMAHRLKFARRYVFPLCRGVRDIEGSGKLKVACRSCETRDGPILPDRCMFHDRVTCDRDKAGKPRLWCRNALAASDDDLEEEPLRPRPRIARLNAESLKSLCMPSERYEDELKSVRGSTGSSRQGSVFPVSPTTLDRTLMCRGKQQPEKPAKTAKQPVRGIARFLHRRASPGQSSSPLQLGEKKEGLPKRRFPDSVCIPNLGSVEQDVHDPARMAGKVSNLLQSQSAWDLPKTALVRVATCDVLGCMPQ